MNAEIITIGDEILIGQIVDTNSAWMATELSNIGVRVQQITSIADHPSEIALAFASAEKRVDIIFITGGLGPTKDDITKQSLADYFAVGWKTDFLALENVKAIFARLSTPLLDSNQAQAQVPDNCQVIQNSKGTAPGMWFEERGKIWISMPGVPHEMMEMMNSFVLPKLLQDQDLPPIVHQTLLTAGVAESFLSKQLESIEDQLPPHIKLAYLPKLGQVRLRLSAYGSLGISKNLFIQEVKIWTDAIIKVVEKNLIWVGDGTIAEAILYQLDKSNKTLAIAESCTGGFISKELTSIAGASKSYLGGIIPYSNALKIKLLGVREETLQKFGAVSEESVREMASGLIENLQADYALATSGIAGPDGGSQDKPIGTVWIAWGTKNNIHTQKYIFGKDRLINIERASTMALTLLLSSLKNTGL